MHTQETGFDFQIAVLQNAAHRRNFANIFQANARAGFHSLTLAFSRGFRRSANRSRRFLTKFASRFCHFTLRLFERLALFAGFDDTFERHLRACFEIGDDGVGPVGPLALALLFAANGLALDLDTFPFEPVAGLFHLFRKAFVFRGLPVQFGQEILEIGLDARHDGSGVGQNRFGHFEPGGDIQSG